MTNHLAASRPICGAGACRQDGPPQGCHPGPVDRTRGAAQQLCQPLEGVAAALDLERERVAPRGSLTHVGVAETRKPPHL
jgi:hypothetical protein